MYDSYFLFKEFYDKGENFVTKGVGVADKKYIANESSAIWG